MKCHTWFYRLQRISAFPMAIFATVFCVFWHIHTNQGSLISMYFMLAHRIKRHYSQPILFKRLNTQLNERAFNISLQGKSSV